MHGLNEINKLNEQAHADSIQTARRSGLHVVAKFTGLHLASTSTHATAKEASEEQARIVADASPDVRVVVYPPLTTQEPVAA